MIYVAIETETLVKEIPKASAHVKVSVFMHLLDLVSEIYQMSMFLHAPI